VAVGLVGAAAIVHFVLLAGGPSFDPVAWDELDEGDSQAAIEQSVGEPNDIDKDDGYTSLEWEFEGSLYYVLVDADGLFAKENPTPCASDDCSYHFDD